MTYTECVQVKSVVAMKDRSLKLCVMTLTRINNVMFPLYTDNFL